MVEGASDDAAAETSATPPPSSTPPNPVDEQGPKTVINWVAQQKVDAELKQEVPTKMVLEIRPDANQPVESTVEVKLAAKPVTFKPDETLKVGTTVYVLKHSPKMQASVTFTMSGKNAVELDPTNIEISEKIKLTKVLARTGADREKRVHTLSCMLNSEVTDKPEAQGQWLMVDCAAPPPGDDKPEEKKVFAANCKKTDTPPGTQPIQ